MCNFEFFLKRDKRVGMSILILSFSTLVPNPSCNNNQARSQNINNEDPFFTEEYLIFRPKFFY